MICQNAIELLILFLISMTIMYRVALNSMLLIYISVDSDISEYDSDNISIASIINSKYQTLTYFGVDKTELLDFVVNNRLSGIDRIVPVGKVLEGRYMMKAIL